LFELALPKARRLYLTEVEADVAGDVVLAPIDERSWREVRREAYPVGEGDQYPFTFRQLEKR
jgi:dihydrofolate reductase